MSKLSKTILILLLAGGCVTQQEPIEETKKPEFAKPVGVVSSPDQGQSVPNPIEVMMEQTNTEADQNHSGFCNYPVITQMTDESLKDKINTTLKDSVMFYCEDLTRDKIPAFQGLFTHFERKVAIRQRFVTSYITYNQNNILSVMVHIQFYTGTKTEYGSTLTLAGINIDLTTGNQVNLSDLFVNGYDFESAINAVILEHTQSHWYEPGEVPYGTATDEYTGWGNTAYVMNYAFNGIRPSQKFFIQENGIEMIFDETTPEFNCQIMVLDYPDYQAFTIFVPFPQDGTAIKQRFTK